jgi:hypothetical protein
MTILDRLRTLNALPDEGHPSSALKPDIPRLRRRATLTNKAIFLSVYSGVAAAVLLIVTFLAASLRYSFHRLANLSRGSIGHVCRKGKNCADCYDPHWTWPLHESS